ncbi:RNase H [Carex littledalei]|uniref:RNase H n=1 Tax=Carex littledalei TaxID=544730 RepID=A0A833VM57_9POAL|nr:RNase H [Carex littledalei]
MALRVSDLPLDFASALLEVTTVLEDTQITYFCNILWCIWKARNQEIFSSKKATRQRILKQAQMMEMHIQQTTESSQTTIRSRVNIAAPLSGTQIVLLDASWDTNRKAGWGAVYYNHRGNINRVQYGFMGAEDPFHAESMALLNVLQNCQSHGLVQRGGTMHIFSDCKTMVRAIQCNELGDLPSWRATETIAQCIQILQQWGELCYCGISQGTR